MAHCHKGAPSNTSTNWILNIRRVEGGKAAVLLHLQTVICSCSNDWQCLYLCTQLFLSSCNSFTFCSTFVASLPNLHPSFRSSLFWCCLAAIASWRGTPNPNRHQRHWKWENWPKPTNQTPAGPPICLHPHTFPSSFFFFLTFINFLMKLRLRRWQLITWSLTPKFTIISQLVQRDRTWSKHSPIRHY